MMKKKFKVDDWLPEIVKSNSKNELSAGSPLEGGQGGIKGVRP